MAISFRKDTLSFFGDRHRRRLVYPVFVDVIIVDAYSRLVLEFYVGIIIHHVLSVKLMARRIFLVVRVSIFTVVQVRPIKFGIS